MTYYSKSIKAVMTELKTSEKGLSTKEAKNRLNKYGKNVIGTEKKISILKLFINQFNDPLIWVLIFAVGLSFLIEHYIDASVILVILIFNAILGFTQEYKAEKAILLLEKLREIKTKLMRNGKEIEILTDKLVPGDIIILEEGDKVPADARLIEVSEFKVDEASLTGESSAVKKVITP